MHLLAGFGKCDDALVINALVVLGLSLRDLFIKVVF